MSNHIFPVRIVVKKGTNKSCFFNKEVLGKEIKIKLYSISTDIEENTSSLALKPLTEVLVMLIYL